MTTPTAARVPGHTLRWEGRTGMSYGYPNDGVCSCGARSGDLPTAAARKRWHREHKGDVIAAERDVAGWRARQEAL